jgi:hypothetical protein
MIDSPECPVCANIAWREIGRRTFFREQANGAKGWTRTAFAVLFDVWLPGANEFAVTYQLCEHCGFVLYTPRPTTEEIDSKYRFSSGLTAHSPVVPYSARREKLRARRIFDILSPYLPDARGACILDFGGGDGRLMRYFAEAGAECHLLDYNTAPIPGVVLIGNSEKDLQSSAAYDAIVCSHVVEHVVRPLPILSTLASRLKQDGTIYVEVPVEIWKRPPFQTEPVTHLNFFTPSSLRNLVARTGLYVDYCRYNSYPHPHGGWRLVASCIARKRSNQEQVVPADGVSVVENLLHPGLGLKIKRRLLLAKDVPDATLRKARRWAKARRAA